MVTEGHDERRNIYNTTPTVKDKQTSSARALAPAPALPHKHTSAFDGSELCEGGGAAVSRPYNGEWQSRRLQYFSPAASSIPHLTISICLYGDHLPSFLAVSYELKLHCLFGDECIPEVQTDCFLRRNVTTLPQRVTARPISH